MLDPNEVDSVRLDIPTAGFGGSDTHSGMDVICGILGEWLGGERLCLSVRQGEVDFVIDDQNTGDVGFGFTTFFSYDNVGLGRGGRPRPSSVACFLE